MLFTSVRERPHMARARVLSSRGANASSPFSWVMTISSLTDHDSSPLGPFTAMVWPSIMTCTLAGMEIGFLPMRDISVHPAEDFAAHIGVARRSVGHHALGRRQDGNAEAVLHRLQIGNAGIDPAARLGDAADLGDHRLAVEIFELYLALWEGARVLHQGEAP